MTFHQKLISEQSQTLLPLWEGERGRKRHGSTYNKTYWFGSVILLEVFEAVVSKSCIYLCSSCSTVLSWWRVQWLKLLHNWKGEFSEVTDFRIWIYYEGLHILTVMFLFDILIWMDEWIQLFVEFNVGEHWAIAVLPIANGSHNTQPVRPKWIKLRQLIRNITHFHLISCSHQRRGKVGMRQKSAVQVHLHLGSLLACWQTC